jgi:hypothetical protein
MAKDIARVNSASIEISQSSEHIKNNADAIFWCQSKSRHAPHRLPWLLGVLVWLLLLSFFRFLPNRSAGKILVLNF